MVVVGVGVVDVVVDVVVAGGLVWVVATGGSVVSEGADVCGAAAAVVQAPRRSPSTAA